MAVEGTEAAFAAASALTVEQRMAIFETRITKDFGDELAKIRASNAEVLKIDRE